MGNAATIQKQLDDDEHGSSKTTKTIDKELQREKEENQNKFKILLLGGSESGKTTVFKQMRYILRYFQVPRILHLNGFTKDDTARFKQYIHSNAINSLVQLIEACKMLQLPPDLTIDEDIQKFSGFRKNIQDPENVCLPNENVMHLVSNSRANFTGHAANMAELNNPKSLRKTIHIHSSRLSQIETRLVVPRMVDVGGQRTERRKWMHCFDNVDMILFIIAISDYDLRDPEDETQNRMMQNFEIFKTIVQNEFFRNCSIVLFLNKYDIFREKLARSSLRVCYPEYKGDNSVEDATAYVQKQFRRCLTDRKKYFAFETTATDTNQIDLVFGSAVNHIVSENLKSTGLHD